MCTYTHTETHTRHACACMHTHTHTHTHIVTELNQTLSSFQEFQQGLETGQLQEGGVTLGRWPESLFEVPVPVRCLNGDTRFDADFWQMNDAEVQKNSLILDFSEDVY